MNVPGNQLRLLHEQVCAANSATVQEAMQKAAAKFNVAAALPESKPRRFPTTSRVIEAWAYRLLM